MFVNVLQLTLNRTDEPRLEKGDILGSCTRPMTLCVSPSRFQRDVEDVLTGSPGSFGGN